jgi:hypothetical protein
MEGKMSFEGYDSLFEEGCDRLVSVWQSHVDEMRGDVVALIKAYRKYSPEDKLVDELMAKYQVTREEV